MQTATVLSVLQEFNTISCIARLLIAAILGGAIGYERERHGRAAGLRTHILVCIGATTAVIAGLFTSYQLGFSNDPLRAGAQVISGIGFLGAGTILLRNDSHVIGLTTAASLWTTAAIGLIVGAGFYSFAIVATIVVIASMVLLGKAEAGKRRRLRERAYYLEIYEKAQVQEIIDYVAPHHVRILPARSGLPNRMGIRIVIVETKNLKDASVVAKNLRERAGVALLIPDDE